MKGPPQQDYLCFRTYSLRETFIKAKEFDHLYVEGFGKFGECIKGRPLPASFHGANKGRRSPNGFGQLFLSQVTQATKKIEPLSKALSKF
jgi:hypothetical protein